MIKTLLKRLVEVKKERDEIEYSLKKKEIESYLRYKKDNPKDRSAMDKIVAELKFKDEGWKYIESRFIKKKVEYEALKLINDVVLRLLNRDDFSMDDIYCLIEELLVGVK